MEPFCRYNLTSWAIQLNEITPSLKEKLAPTDCRLRPDQHHLELGEYDEASAHSNHQDKNAAESHDTHADYHPSFQISRCSVPCETGNV